jgi:hypothetical protein
MKRVELQIDGLGFTRDALHLSTTKEEERKTHRVNYATPSFAAGDDLAGPWIALHGPENGFIEQLVTLEELEDTVSLRS